jgi:uncharacterized alpha-E superfamily protein
LAIPNIATWWCGQQNEREFVMQHAADMTIGDAFAPGLLFENDDASLANKTLGHPQDQSTESWIDRARGQLVGQEAVNLSTTPAFDGEYLVPRPMSLRVFLARNRQGWQVMPGGIARIGRSDHSAELALQYGGSSADVWIVSQSNVPADTMFDMSKAFLRQQPGVLPSRAADNLFWLGRYVERAEHAIRLLRAYHARLAESDTADTPLLRAIDSYLVSIGTNSGLDLQSGVGSPLASASRSASHIRDQFSVDGWHALADLLETVQQLSTTITAGDNSARAMSILLRKLSGFSGLVHENMYRFMSWRFLSIGKSMERALSISSLLVTFTDPHAPDGSLDLAVEAGDSAMTHRRRYAVATNAATVTDLLALDPLNPRSVIYQLNEISEHLGFLPGAEEHRQLSPLQRAMLRTKSNLATHTPETLDVKALSGTYDDILTLSDQFGIAYLR